MNINNNFKDKYLKYKNKYLELKKEQPAKMSGGNLDKLTTEMCMSYITDLLGYMDTAVEGIQKYIDVILNKLDYPDPQKSFIEIMKVNYANIKELKVVYMNAENPIYPDLFYFIEEENKDGKRIFILESNTRKGKNRISKILNTETLTQYRNTLVGLPADDGAHWIFIDSETKIHNPYNYNMQLNHSHQFCQSHSLFMAIVPQSRQKCENYNNASLDEEENEKLQRKCAYDRLMIFLSIVLPYITLYSIEKKYKVTGKRTKKTVMLTGTLYEDVIDEIRTHNITEEDEKYHEYINNFMNNFKKIEPGMDIMSFSKYISNSVFTIMNSEYAKREVPEWGLEDI